MPVPGVHLELHADRGRAGAEQHGVEPAVGRVPVAFGWTDLCVAGDAQPRQGRYRVRPPRGPIRRPESAGAQPVEGRAGTVDVERHERGVTPGRRRRRSAHGTVPRNSRTAVVNASFSSPATMCPAPRTSKDRAPGTSRTSSATASASTTSLRLPRTTSSGTVIDRAASSRSSVDHLGTLGDRAAGLAGEEPGVPVPPPASRLFVQPQHPGETRDVAVGSGPAGVPGDRVGCIFECLEAVGLLGHEAQDAIGTRHVDAGCDVDEHHRAEELALIAALRDEGRESAEACSDDDRWRVERIEDRFEVVGEVLDLVLGVLGPVAVTVTTMIDAQHGESRLRDRRRGVMPGVSCLPGTVEEQHHLPRWRPIAIRRQGRPPAPRRRTTSAPVVTACRSRPAPSRSAARPGRR